MKTSLILAFYFFLQAEVPFKNSDEFQVQIDLKFKPKQNEFSPNSYSTSGTRLDATKVESFLMVNVTQLKNPGDEVRMQAKDSKGKTIFKRKCSPDDIHVEMGFLSDLKNGSDTKEITIFFLSSEKKELRKIVFAVLSDGTFLVNGNSHGKF